MTLKTTKLRDAITFALAVGATAVAGTGVAFAQDTTTTTTTTTTAPAEQQATTLDRIEVTGSRIRRVDAENASPVVTIDRAAIEKTGKLTLGDLIQELPNMAGAPTNPQVNNGGGTGASTIDLRGMGSARTLTLIDGHRIINGDVNAIPASAVERIEVLTVGASSVYGSDAIAGVVNFIMRKDFQGMEASLNYGLSSRGDGERTGGSVTFGQTGEKGNVIAGIDYNKFKAISAADRDFSKDATYLYYGSSFVAGSSRNPFGRIFLPSGDPVRTALGCSSVTRIAGAPGNSTADYRCYSGATDAYNYQRTNLILTPQERTNAFFLGNYQITDDVSAYLQVYHNKTSSGFAIAALPFDANSDGVLISKDNYYNPFGIDFGAGTNQFMTRFTSLGQRMSFNATTTDQVFAGVTGFLGDTWKWDFGVNYGHVTQDSETHGYVYYEGLRAALGPSFLDPATNTVTCGTATAPIANCTPLNIFNINDPQTIATLQQYAVNPMYRLMNDQKGFEANASGELFNLPAGAVQLAFGGAWHRDYLRTTVDYVAVAGADGTCFISQEACGSALSGSFSVGELYGEMFVPILKDVPFAKALNVTFGSRFSNYSDFGNTVNNKLQVEWRPFNDLLVRGTVADVFRAPTISDLYAGPQGNAPQAQDPCAGYTNDPAHAGACGAGTGATAIDPVNGIGPQANSQLTGVISGARYAGYQLKPEQGRSYDWGMVYDPSWLSGASMSLDYWRLTLGDNISTIGAQTVLTQCYNDNNSPYCPFIHRFANGDVSYISQPTVNLGRLDATGWDLALRYKMPSTAFGSFNFGFDGTYIAKWDNDVDTTTNADPIVHLAGNYNKDYGMYSRVRGRLFADWSLGDWSASWRTRYIGAFDIPSGDGACAYTGNFCDPLSYSSYVTHALQVGYALPSINSRLEVGVDNVFDKQPPVLYQNNVLNANTDVNTFDTIGRYYWARYTVKF
ncbi:TonB-dependent receptor domain-containing protein [Cognatiluteimonas profundi]|uniref:TonB-dependent receptor domain-containing protein n=1 Tax=Cognatiluteimonas profundi TaxID=2594501 RepID=UPI00131D1D6F|nr:TonB-dependent receptor [Lysobacter profundi]